MEELPELAQTFINLKTGHEYRNYMRSFTQNNFNMVQILGFVCKHKQVHPNEMSEFLSIATSQMAVLLNHLEQQELIERIKDEHDHRKTIIKITSKGRNIYKKVIDRYRLFIEEVFREMGQKDAQKFVQLFSEFMDAGCKVFEERNINGNKTNCTSST
ncbi:MAG: MarR family winged helix-turn-helix transcriptional regulator [Bacillota bacterium]|nr:MarR family winged helix-turn-helix transcriptional regulator [Bacillota bacterium]